ncbi:MAG TPA: carbohydrate ABC transporter permease [Chloroflexota bacterium]|nr:carbohydrate ABC transporter permease [Chloroflexota bacterium]
MTTLQRGALQLFMTLCAAVLLLPLYWMVTTSLKAVGKEWLMPPQWIPNPVVWSNYPDALTALPFNYFFRNTVLIVVLATAGTVLTSTMAGFAFARLRFPARGFLFTLVLATMMLPNVVTLIPTFLLFKQLGWLNTLLPLIVPYWLGGTAFSIFLSRQFFLAVPYELDEAARVDGASNYRIYAAIMLPLSPPLIGALAIFSVLHHWNEFLGPLIYVNRMELRTLALGLRSFQGSFASNYALMMAAATVTVLPVVALFFAAQRFFMRGVLMTGLAGR